jgi:hyperosmotically inducible protein
MTPKLVLLLCLAVFPAACASGSSSVRPMNSNPAAMDDATVSARVKAALLNDQQLNATKITVSTEGGVVNLTGSVRSKAEETRAIDLARQVTGVRDVKSSLQVGPIPQF